VEVELKRLSHDHQLLIEKNKQLKAIIEINDGEIPLDVFQKLQKDDLIRDNPKEVKYYRTKAQNLLKDVEQLSQEIQDKNIKEEVYRKYEEKMRSNPTNKFDLNMMQLQIEAMESKAETLEKEITTTTKSYAVAISDLKRKILQFDSILADKKRQ